MNDSDQHLNKNLLSQFDNTPTTSEQQSLMFAFSARSGSTVITSSWAKLGLAKEITEIFNPRAPVQNLLRRLGGENINDYLNNVHGACMYSDKLIFKTSYPDFLPVSRRGLVDKLLPGLSVVYIERKDKVLQAVSVYKAILSNQWHKKSSDEFTTDISVDQPIDLKKISKFVGNFENESKKWRKFFSEQGIEPIQVWYEDFDQAPERTLQAVYSKLVGTECTERVELSHKKLRDEVSLCWAERVRDYLAQ